MNEESEAWWSTTVGSYPPSSPSLPSGPGRLARLIGRRSPKGPIRQARFPNCAHCRGVNYRAIQPADAFVSAGWHFVRQWFQCAACGVKRRLVRRLDRDWTTNTLFARMGHITK